MSAVVAVLDLARADGAVRADVTIADLAVLLDGAPGREVPAVLRARYVEIVIAGLTSRVAT